MVDLSDKVPDPKDMNAKDPEASSSSSDDGIGLKKCADCGTSKTPLWRGGPAGPKSLCNACGIRSRKKRRAILGLNKSEEKKPKKTNNDSLNQRLLAIGREVMMQRSSMDKQMRKLGEEEQAAVLLMAISCGSVYA
ncbi:hypothetical protein V2J09_023099 [Rumex salicifolius]